MQTAQVSRVLSSAPVELAARTGLQRRHLGLVLRRRPVRRSTRPTGSDGSPSCPNDCSPPTASITSTRSVQMVLENKFYADLHGTITTQQRVRIAPEFTAVHVDRAEGNFFSMRTLAPRGRARLGVPHRHRMGLRRRARRSCPSCCASTSRHPASTPATYDVVIDPSNLWLTIHESIGHATELDRALGYEAAYAGTSFATPDQLGTLQLRQPGHERDRRPHGRERPGDDRLRRRRRHDAAVRHRQGRHARRLPAQPADGARQRATARHRALERVRVRRLGRAHSRCSVWRMCRSSPRRTARPPKS